MEKKRNVDYATVRSFGAEWSRYDQSEFAETEARKIFGDYFSVFPWGELPQNPEGFDMGCGSGRWARFVAPRVRLLNCIEPSKDALESAKKVLRDRDNVRFFEATSDECPLPDASQDFGYSLGVLHHVPDTAKAFKDCSRLLKPGAPFLVYLYYRFDDRPRWFRLLWQISEVVRHTVSSLPNSLKPWVTDFLAVSVYWPLARLSRICGKLGIEVSNFPLIYYRNSSLYTMRTDSRDRFGTPLEQRFCRDEIRDMMLDADLERIRFSDRPPYWVAVGYKSDINQCDHPLQS